MKIFILLLLIELNFSYIPSRAIEYVKKWYEEYNPSYTNYTLDERENINFVSQALFAGGQSFSGCMGKDQYGMISTYLNFVNCLYLKGWKNSTGKIIPAVKPGYPALTYLDRYFMITTKFEGNVVYYCGHRYDECKNYSESKLIFYYK